MLPFIRDHLIPPIMRILPSEEGGGSDDDDAAAAAAAAELSRALSQRVLNHVVRRPYGQPRQVGSLLRSIDRGLLLDDHHGLLLLSRAASAGTLLFAARGRARSMPALSVFRSPAMSYRLLLAAFRGKPERNYVVFYLYHLPLSKH